MFVCSVWWVGVYGLVCSGWTRFVAELWMGGERKATIVGTDLENGSFDGCGAGQTLMGGGVGGPMMGVGVGVGGGWRSWPLKGWQNYETV